MDYKGKIQQSREKVYYHAIATKIRDLMSALRKSSNENRKRRWIWELLQNAKDVSFDGNSVLVEIDFKKNETTGVLVFKHNGKPFTIDNITFLIEQVSTKDQKKNKNNDSLLIGKFGTGFLTTHLLSEIVDIYGVIKEPELPYIDFNLSLDRSPREIEDIIISINNSLSLLDNLDTQSTLDNYNPSNFNTCFQYQLNEKGINVAEIGVNDLHLSLPYSLLFSGRIDSVNIKSDNCIYRCSPNPKILTGNIKIYSVLKQIDGSTETINIVLLSTNYTSIAIEIEYIDNIISLKEFDNQIPKLFCEFPLVGTEDFGFPTIINNPAFSPTEPRDGIDLTDNEDIDIDNNKAFIAEAIELYFELLEYASNNNWLNIHILAKVKTPSEKDWLSTDWFNSEITKPLRNKLLQTPIVVTESGKRIALRNSKDEAIAFFPSHSNSNVRDKIWELAYELFPNSLPAKKLINDWYSILWKRCYRQTLEELTKDIQKKENLEGLSNDIQKTIDEAVIWLNSYFDLLNFEGVFIQEILNDTFSVIPNQHKKFSKKSKLYWDKNIEEKLKDILLIFSTDIREVLRLSDVHTASKYTEDKSKQITHYEKSQDDIITKINKLLVESTENISIKAALGLSALFSDDSTFPKTRSNIYEFAQSIYKTDLPEKSYIKFWNDSIWEASDKIVLKDIVKLISNSETITQFSDNYNFSNSHVAIKWLDSFISFLVLNDYSNLINLKTHPILPNQKGVFTYKDDLFLDDGEIDEPLKEISEELGYNVKELLLDKGVFLELPENRVITRKNIADEIRNKIEAQYDYSLSEEVRGVYKKLLIWFNDNADVAKDLFGDLFVNKHKLYDDSEIVDNIKKAEQLDSILSEFNISNMDKLRELLSLNKGQIISKETNNNPQEILISLGIGSKEELDKILNAEVVPEALIHLSTPTPEMYAYAHSLIVRAKKNIIEHLSNLDEYDCTFYDEIAPSIFGGITKNGEEINIVTRPSDNGEVIIYYPAEKATLDFSYAELWYEDGINTPEKLTLGKLLKTTKINRIPIE